MKKLKPMLVAILLLTFLVGNIFAGDFSSNGLSSFFDSLANAVYSFASGNSICEDRQCQTCRPGSDEGGGTCRPTQ